MSKIEKTKIYVECELGENVRDCIIDAVKLAMDERCDVFIDHNETELIVDYASIIHNVEKHLEVENPNE
ncbi:MAG: hypothetical protein V3V00_15875 [Saprospiraceae bacterium]